MGKEEVIFHKKIKCRENNLDEAKKILNDFEVSEIIAKILTARGFNSDESLKHFLNPTLKMSLPNPKGLKNLEAGAKLVAEHIASGGKVAICSDFDVDGLSGGSLMRAFLNDLGVEATNYVPDRFKDGYGLNLGMVESAAKNEENLLITIDYGTTNHVELAAAKELGLKTIVIDHHHVGDDNVMPADVFINPNQAGCEFKDHQMCAAGLVWIFLIGLRQAIPKAKDIDLRNYLDLACLGTICDMVPLVGVNRLIAKKGLEVLTKTKRPGLIALKKVSGVKKEASSHHIGFGLGPRINSAGRMLNGSIVIDLLTTNDQNKADKIAARLSSLNDKRQEVEQKVKRQAMQSVECRNELPFGIVASGDHFHTGVIGIVAQRLTEKFYRPSAVIGLDNGNYKGSVRGISGFNVIEALGDMPEYFQKFGGHAGAAGFTLQEGMLEDFPTAFNDTVKKHLEGVSLVPYSTADAEITLGDLDFKLCDELAALGPYGVGNAAPLLTIKNLKVREVRSLKAVHLKTTLTDGSDYVDALMWNTARHPALYSGAVVDVVCKPSINNYGGKSSMQLVLQAVQKTESQKTES